MSGLRLVARSIQFSTQFQSGRASAAANRLARKKKTP